MKTLTAILAAMFVSACAATSGSSEPSRSDETFARYEPYLGEPVQSFTALRKDSWQPVSRTQLVLWTSMNHAYMLTVDNTCHDLPFSEVVGVTSTTSQITTHDSVIVRGNRCLIRQIQPIDVRRMRADQHEKAA